MSEYTHRDGGGSIFRNRKKASEKQPDFKGEIKINNIVYEFGVWEKRSDKGTVWLSIGGARPKQDKGEYQKPAEKKYPVEPYDPKPDPFGFDSQIPF